MIVGGYHISNALIAAVLIASTIGGGVATDSFSGITDGIDNPLAGPSDNATDVNDTQDTDNEDSDSSDSSDSQDSSDSSDSSDSQDSSDSDSSDSSDSGDDGGGFLDDILGGGDENETETDTTNETDPVDDTANETDTDTSDNETDDTDNTTESASVEISHFKHPQDSQFYEPYDSAIVPVEIVMEGDNASYEVTIDGETYFSGQLSGSATINDSVELSSTGAHDMVVEITRSGETLQTLTRTFEIASDAIQETGFQKTTTVITGSDAGFRLVDNGENVADATVYLGGSSVGQTDANGEITVSVPYQETITLSTDYSGVSDQTFNVTQDIPEPQITLVNPVDSESFDTPTGTDRDITFEADVDISEDSGTASLMIDGSEAYTQDLSSGTTSISTTQALSGGSHTWSVEVDTPEYNTSSTQRTLSINEQQVQNGLSLQNNATAGEYNYVRLYNNGEPVQGTEITVNGDSIGTTDSNGEVGFEVPNAQEITISASGYSDITRTVEGYEEVNTPLVYSTSIQNPSSGEIQKPFTFEANVDAGLADSYEIKNSNQVFASGSLTENSTNSISESISPPNGEQTLEFVVTNSENGNSTTRSVQVDIWEMIQITSPTEGDSFDSNEVNFGFSLAESLSGEYSILVDGTQKYSDSLGSSTGYSKDLLVSNQGDHTTTIEVDSGQGSYSRSVGFSVNQDADTSATLISPSDGAVIQEPRFTWNVTYPTQYWTYLNIDGSQVAEFERYNDAQISKTAEISPGDHTWQSVVKDEKSSSSQITSAKNGYKLVDITQNEPAGSPFSSPVQYDLDVDTGTNTKAQLYVNGNLEYEEQLSSGSNSVTTSVDRSPGTYNTTFYVVNTESGKNTSKEIPIVIE